MSNGYGGARAPHIEKSDVTESAATKSPARLLWKDTTSYSQGKERVPTCWTLTVEGVRIVVLTGHLYHPDHWVVKCEPWFHERQIAPKQLETHEAQRMALELVEAQLRKAIVAITKAKPGDTVSADGGDSLSTSSLNNPLTSADTGVSGGAE